MTCCSLAALRQNPHAAAMRQSLLLATLLRGSDVLTCASCMWSRRICRPYVMADRFLRYTVSVVHWRREATMSKYSRPMWMVQTTAQFRSSVRLHLTEFTSDISLQSIFVDYIGRRRSGALWVRNSRDSQSC